MASPLRTLLPLLILFTSGSFAASDSIYDSFLQCLRNQTGVSEEVSSIVYAPTNPSYTSVLRAYIRNARFNTSSVRKPLLIVTPLHELHVQATVICSKRIGIHMKVRSGGHDYAGISYISDVPFVILDMFNLRSVTVDVDDQSAWVQSGAILGELYHAIAQKSNVLGFPAGICPTVGVGGHISGAGYGNLLRKHGLSVDHVVDAQIVDVNGRILVKESMGEDLFWAIRGGGASSFGVLIAYKIKLVPVPEIVTVFRVERSLDENATDIVYKWQSVAPSIDENLFMRMLLQPISSNVKKGTKTIRASILAEYQGNAEDLVSLLSSEFPELSLKKEDCTEMSWIESVVWWANLKNGNSTSLLLDRNPDSANFLRRKSDYVKTPISKENLEWLWKKMVELGKTGLVFNPYGGKMSQIPASDTPFPHRAGNLFKIQYSVSWEDPGSEAEEKYTQQIRALFSFMTPFVSKNPRSAYWNYRDLDIGTHDNGKNSYEDGKVYGEKYFNGNFDRLMKVKTAVDPQNLFWNEQSIPVLPSEEVLSLAA